MSTSLGVVLKRLAIVLAVAAALLGITMIFTYDIIKIDWPSFMEIQSSYKQMESPLPVPARSIPIEGPIEIAGMGVPDNPTQADDASITRGRELFRINCQMCHGETAEGNGPVAAFLANKPANLTSPVVQAKSDGSIFLTISNGITGKMPPLNENLTVPERWDLVNFVRTLKAAQPSQ